MTDDKRRPSGIRSSYPDDPGSRPDPDLEAPVSPVEALRCRLLDTFLKEVNQLHELDGDDAVAKETALELVNAIAAVLVSVARGIGLDTDRVVELVRDQAPNPKNPER